MAGRVVTATELRDMARRIRSPEFDGVMRKQTVTLSSSVTIAGQTEDLTTDAEVNVETGITDLFTDYEIDLICDALNKSADAIDAERAVSRFLTA